jgi:hypothetical protein
LPGWVGGDLVLAGRQVVELDEPHTAAVRTFGEVEAVGDARGVKQGRDRAVKIGGADARNMNRIEPVGIVGLRQRGRRGLPALWPKLRESCHLRRS